MLTIKEQESKILTLLTSHAYYLWCPLIFPFPYSCAMFKSHTGWERNYFSFPLWRSGGSREKGEIICLLQVGLLQKASAATCCHLHHLLQKPNRKGKRLLHFFSTKWARKKRVNSLFLLGFCWKQQWGTARAVCKSLTSWEKLHLFTPMEDWRERTSSNFAKWERGVFCW